MAKILIVGCGSIGVQLGLALSASSHQVTGLKRNITTLPNSMTGFQGDISDAEQIRTLDDDFEVVFFIVSPEQRTESAYRLIYETGMDNLLNHFSGQSVSPQWFFISSTSVYGQNLGEWVDEHSPAEPQHTTSKLIRAGELKLLLNAQVKHTVVRFSGIYGPGRDWLIRKTRQAPVIQKNPPYYTNRIHQDDCVGVLVFLLDRYLSDISLEHCYLASDDHPAPQWEVISWLARALHVNQPEAKTESDTAAQNKRCNNQAIKSLGYTFKYPDFQSGYEAMLKL